MDRLTYRLTSGAANLVGILEAKNPAEKAALRQIGWDRLAEYEDTGLKPDEVASLRAELARERERADEAATDLKYYLENIESKGVVFIPTFVVEKIIIGFEWRGKEDDK